jgi:hypothetical protein
MVELENKVGVPFFFLSSQVVTAPGTTLLDLLVIFLLCIMMVYALYHPCFYQTKLFINPTYFVSSSHKVFILNPPFIFSFSTNPKVQNYKINKSISNVF